MQLDPALATVIVAAIGLLGSYFATRATRSGKAKEAALTDAAADRAKADQKLDYLERSRDAAIEDATRFRVERDASDAHNAVLIQALIAAGLPVPPRPTGGTP